MHEDESLTYQMDFCVDGTGSTVKLSLSACDNSIDPIDRENGIFAIYGALDLNEQTNYIRVRDLNAPFTGEATREIDAEVTLENLNSAFTEILEGESTFNEGIYLHNFKVTQPILPDTEYQVVVRRSDGRNVSKVITTPTRPVPYAIPTNENCYTPINVTFEPANGGIVAFRIGIPLSTTYWAPQQLLRTAEETTLTFTPVDYVKRIPGTLGSLRCHDLAGNNFFVSYTHYSKGFYEAILENPLDIFESTQRFGAVYSSSLTIPIDTSRVCPPDC